MAPRDLTGAHELSAAEGMGEAHAAVVALRVALADNALDDPAGDARRPWPELVAVLDRVNSELRPAADYAGMGLVLPDLITDLHAVAASHGAHRREALGGLLDVYTAATFTAKHLGEPDLATVAAMHARAVAAELGTPRWPSCCARRPCRVRPGPAAWCSRRPRPTGSRRVSAPTSERRRCTGCCT